MKRIRSASFNIEDSHEKILFYWSYYVTTNFSSLCKTALSKEFDEWKKTFPADFQDFIDKLPELIREVEDELKAKNKKKATRKGKVERLPIRTENEDEGYIKMSALKHDPQPKAPIQVSKPINLKEQEVEEQNEKRFRFNIFRS